MTELEKIEYTKKFIDQLANGINPIDGKVIPENDIMNNVRMVRCMFYVSDILRQIIDNGGITSQKRTSGGKKTDFSLNAEQRNSFPYSASPISISEITKRLNELKKDDSMKNITHNMITSWLVQSGILAEEIDDGKTRKKPTETAYSLGITLEYREGINGLYSVVLYNINAQHFILDNMDAVISYNAASKIISSENQGQPWTYEQNQQLINMVFQDVPIEEISRTLKRSKSAITARMNKLGIS